MIDMKHIKNENVVCFDVDDTLVTTDPAITHGCLANVYDAITKKYITVRVLEANVRLLREEKRKGFFIVVWSRSGNEWASNVVKALDLEKEVDLTMSKPLVYIDDRDVSEWLPYRVWLPPSMNYKKSIIKGE